jgi:ATP-dependent Clp protease adapter protein ClpS
MALDDDANALLDAARVDARRRGHVEVTLGHLMLAALESPATIAILTRRAVDPRRARALFEARVSAVPPIAGYRDAPPQSRLSPALTELVEATVRKRKRLFVQLAAREVDILLAALAAPSVAAILEEATFDVAPVERLSEAATALARGYAHVNVLVDHAVLAMIDIDPAFGEALRVLGHDPKAVRRRLDLRLRSDVRSHLLAPLGQLIEFAATRTYLAPGQHELTIAPIVVDLLRHPSVRAAVEAVDVNRYDLLYAYVHGRVPPKDVVFRSEGTVDVVFYDDSFSTMELVVSVLTGAFGLSDAEAKQKMLAVHEEGHAVVATMPRDRASAAIIRALGQARDELMPLRMEMVQSVALSMTNR